MPLKDKQKRKKYLKNYYKKNREKFLVRSKMVYEKNPEVKKNYGHEYHRKHYVKQEQPTNKQLTYWEILKQKIPWNWAGKTQENKRIRHLVEYKLWRKSCLERDNYICQKTKISGGSLEVHHIKNFSEFPELRFAIDNGITLSKESHKRFHKIYGKTNNTKEQLVEFLCQEDLYLNPSFDSITQTG